MYVCSLEMFELINILLDIFTCIFLKGNFYFLFQISLKFVLLGPIGHELSLIQVLAWC